MKCASHLVASTPGGCCLLFITSLHAYGLHSFDGEIRFTDVTEASGISFMLDVPDDDWFNYAHFFGGIGLGDFDRDGSVDIYFTGGGGDHDTLYLNDGDGNFTLANYERIFTDSIYFDTFVLTFRISAIVTLA